jgi:hypothetical protein
MSDCLPKPKLKVWIDDEIQPPRHEEFGFADKEWAHVRTFDEARACIKWWRPDVVSVRRRPDVLTIAVERWLRQSERLRPPVTEFH